MGNSTSRVVGCFVPSSNHGKDGVDLDFLEPLDEGLGHSFCYIRPVVVDSPAITPSISERYTVDSSTLDSETHSGSFRKEDDLQRPNKSLSETTFKSISGASVSANVSTARTGNLNVLLSSDAQEPAASFESTASFAAIPLQPVPRGSGPLNGFMSGPLERGFMSGPIDKAAFMSGPLEVTDRSNFSAPLVFDRRGARFGRLVRSVSRPVKNALSRTFTRRDGWIHRFFLQPVTQLVSHPKFRPEASRNCVEVGSSVPEYSSTRNLQWAHGKAGEDRVHVVLSEHQGWLFVGIYDGFSGPDAPEFLMSNLYKAIDKELEGLLWVYDDKPGNSASSSNLANDAMVSSNCVLDGCVVSQLGLENQHMGSQSCGDCFGNQCDEVAVLVCPKKDECGGEPSTAGGQTLEIDAIAQDMGDANTERAVHIDVLGSGFMRRRKSKRLYELLQMEQMEDYEVKVSSWDSQQSKGEELYTRRSLPAELVLCSRSIGGGTAGCMEEASSFRESEGGLEENSRDPDLRSVTSFSPLSHKQMMKISFIRSKLRKMFRKQKSLRKKLFPWSYDWHRDKTIVDERILDPSAFPRKCKLGPVDHDAVLMAMSRALDTTEEAYMQMVEEALDINPELALMGSCVLVMLMKDQDVYVMNLGDSRVILAQDRLHDHGTNINLAEDDARHLNRSRESLVRVELDRISEESPMHNPKSQICKINKSREISLCRLKMRAVQLSTDHSTNIEEEIVRIKTEHDDDAQAIMNDRVKGQLKVTRAFGAGFLKKPEFNGALLEMFRVDYIGTSPYVSCIPSVLHHRLCSNDRFLVLSSDGLYQYFSNEEVVSHVAWFIENVPEGDPAQYLIAELLFRAAKKNGMEFHDLLDIPHGDRRKYHDDVSVMVISLEGRIWRSSG